jgi:plastocyanin
MSKIFLGAFCAFAMFAATQETALAQEQPASPAELTLRVGDTITWTPQAPHRVRFGGSVGPLALTKFSDVQKVLENFNPPPPPADADGAVIWPGGAVVSAKVKADTGTPAVTEFFFTCGFPPHNNLMLTATFKVEAAVAGQPARNIQIVSANPPHWVLQTTPGNPAGDRSLKRP